jgi:hypothetical protein
LNRVTRINAKLGSVSFFCGGDFFPPPEAGNNRTSALAGSGRQEGPRNTSHVGLREIATKRVRICEKLFLGMHSGSGQGALPVIEIGHEGG